MGLCVMHASGSLLFVPVLDTKTHQELQVAPSGPCREVRPRDLGPTCCHSSAVVPLWLVDVCCHCAATAHRVCADARAGLQCCSWSDTTQAWLQCGDLAVPLVCQDLQQSRHPPEIPRGRISSSCEGRIKVYAMRAGTQRGGGCQQGLERVICQRRSPSQQPQIRAPTLLLPELAWCLLPGAVHVRVPGAQSS